MDAAVSSILGAMGPLLRKLDLLLAPEYKLRKQVKGGIELLKEDLEEVSSALVDLSMVNNPRQRAKCWMEEARELSYDIEDFVEGMMLPCTHADAKMRSVRRWRVGRVKVPRLPATPKLRTRMAKIAHFRSLLQEASDRHQRYQLHLCGSSPSRIVSELGRVPALYGDATNLVGIGDPRTELINMVAMEEDPELKVLSIVGPAGVGKTTLAKEAFRQLGGQFECRAFVRASRKPGIRRLLGSILSQVQGCHQTPPGSGPVQNLVDTLRAHLQVKRYLIVIDDLWDKTAWDIVHSAFPEANNCNRVITTTENMNAALEFCSYLPSNILKMKPLGIDDSRKLFISRVFGSEHQCPDEKKELSDGIIRRCGGLPLAIISLAGLLANQSEKLWYHVRDCLLSIPCRSHTMQKEILSLSYKSLPHYLKACLLYFKMYPEDCIIWKVDLVKQWIAEGFVNVTEGQDTEKVAQTHFDELVTRGMIQPMQINYNDEVLSCTVHNAIYDLITHGSKEENFTADIDYSQPITRLCTKVRRLSLHFTSARYAKQPAGITMPQLRSFAFFGLLKCMPSIAEFKLLRILILEFLENQEGHTSLDLSTIFRFLLLRYLKVSGDIMVDLPAQMQGLKYLETLEINARHCAVPSDIVHLPSLLHLGLQGAAKLPDGIGCIRSLITLLYFDIGHNSEENVWSLGKLTNLRHLHLTCSVLLSSEHLMRKLIPLFSSLGKLGNLKSLILAPGALGMPVFVDITRSIYTPRSFSLQILELLPPICFFFRLPNWIGQLHTLGILKIGISELRENDINNLAGLPSLMVLSLYVRVAPDGPIVFTNMSFPALKYLKVRCSEMYLTFQEGAMSNIQRLKLCFNANRGENYGLVLKGIEYLSNLQEICGRIGAGIGANESDVKSAESVFQDAIRKHPKCRSFNVKRVDLIQEKYIAEKQHLRQQEGSSGEHHIPVRDYTEDTNKHAGSRIAGVFHVPLVAPSTHRNSDEVSTHHMLSSFLQDGSTEPRKINVSLLIDITKNFSSEQEIGGGRFGVVYKGELPDGIVAVKRLYKQPGNVDKQFAHVVKCLMAAKHSNILRFMGYCVDTQLKLKRKEVDSLYSEQPETLLCFEYLHNGNLWRHIADESCGFEWHVRYKIIEGICHGLDYLHGKGIIHLDLKPENILLDASMVPKIGDYGYSSFLSEDRRNLIGNTAMSQDHMAPEYFEDQVISIKSDIYSLGVIIMQIVAGRKDHPNIERVLRNWRSRLELDTTQRHGELEAAYRQVKVCIETGLDCMERDPRKRPAIRDIIHKLGETRTTQGSVGSHVTASSVTQTSPPVSKIIDDSMQLKVQQSSEVSKTSLSSTPDKNLKHQARITSREKKFVFKVSTLCEMCQIIVPGMSCEKCRSKVLAKAAKAPGVTSFRFTCDRLEIVGNDVNVVSLVSSLRKVGLVEIQGAGRQEEADGGEAD